tara:strand:- start:17 stop:766 length:750 start_codon:yes stop_codon:yes gene_type:complete
MPIFSGSVRVNSSTGTVLDLTDRNNVSRSGRSQVKGVGVFENTTNRDNVSTNLRTQGYMAVVKSGPTSVTPYFYKNTDVSGWTDSNNWMSLAALTGGLPQGGSQDNILAKTSDSDYESQWVNSITLETAQLKKIGGSEIPTLTFSKQKTSEILRDGESLGELNSIGFNVGGDQRSGAAIKFVADGTVNSGIGSRVEFWTSDSEGENTSEKALTIDTDKKLIFAGSNSSPIAVEGGMYFNNDTKTFYLGV